MEIPKYFRLCTDRKTKLFSFIQEEEIGTRIKNTRKNYYIYTQEI